MIQTWIADVSALQIENIYREYYSEVPNFRQRKADRLRMQEDKALSIGAWILLEMMKKEYSLQGEAVYNLSHSGRYALCAVEDTGASDRKLGCDLEQIRENHMKVAKRFFCPTEYQWVNAYEGRAKVEQFYRMWVLKESFLKATHKGMQLDMKSYEIGFLEGDRPYLMRAPQEFAEDYHFCEYVVEGLPYRIAVCADCDAFAPEIHRIVL